METLYLSIFTFSLALLTWAYNYTSTFKTDSRAVNTKIFNTTLDLQASIQLHSEQNCHLQGLLRSETEKSNKLQSKYSASLQDHEHTHQLHEEQIQYLRYRLQQTRIKYTSSVKTCQAYEEQFGYLQANLKKVNLVCSDLRGEISRLNSELEAAQYNFMSQKFRSECYASQLQKDGHDLAKLWTPTRMPFM